MQPQTVPNADQGTHPAKQVTATNGQQQQQLVQALPRQNVVIQTGNVVQTAPRVVDHYPVKASLITAGLQLVIGIFLIILNIHMIRSNIKSPGQGFWCGGMFTLTGIVGFFAAKFKKTGASIFMASSILACVIAVVGFGLSFLLLACAPCYDGLDDSESEARSRMFLAMLIILIVGLIVAIVSSSLYCCGFCCCQTVEEVVLAHGQSVQYVTTHGYPVAFTQGPQLPATNHAPGAAGTSARQRLPSKGQPMPSPEQPMPSKGKPLPSAEQPIPTLGQPMSSKGQPMPSAEQRMPSAEQPMPGRGQPMPGVPPSYDEKLSIGMQK